MPRFWAMGVSATNCATDLASLALAHNQARESIIDREAELHAKRTGMEVDEARKVVRDAVSAGRRRLALAGAGQQPNLNDHGVAAPAVIDGESYVVTGVEYQRGGDRIIEAVRPLGGGRFATRRIRQCVDGGEFTRVVAEARGS